MQSALLKKIDTQDVFPYGNKSGLLTFISTVTNFCCLPGEIVCHTSSTKPKRLVEGRLLHFVLLAPWTPSLKARKA